MKLYIESTTVGENVSSPCGTEGFGVDADDDVCDMRIEYE